MQVFISWSGERSRAIADALRNWLPKVIQSVRPWMSDEDISAGSRWLGEVSSTLNNSTIGIICVTPENQHQPWLLFEAGALSKTVDESFVCPIVYDMTVGELSGPLTQFQANTLTKQGIIKILMMINRKLTENQIDSQDLEEIIEVWWDKLASQLENLPKPNTKPASRTTDDKLEELLELSRENLRRENVRLESLKNKQDEVFKLVNYLEHNKSVMAALKEKMASSIDVKSLIEHEIIKNAKHNWMSNEELLENKSTLPITEILTNFGLNKSLLDNVLDVERLDEMTDLIKSMQKESEDTTAKLLNKQDDDEVK